jgi:cephalosporin hydroxylase
MRSLLTCGWRNHQLAARVIADRECLQRKWELMAMMALVKRQKPRLVVEIGTYRGGTLRCWSAVTAAGTHFISIDLPGGDFGGGYSSDDAERFRTMLKPGQTLHCIRADSHDPETRKTLAELLGPRRIDFLFIDGDHTYEGVKADFELYRDLMAPGGLVALHDIMPHQVHDSCRVHEFWSELKEQPAARELVDRDGFETWGGIGVVRV